MTVEKMKLRFMKAVVAAPVAAIAVSSCLLISPVRDGKMDNMEPTGDTVEINPRISADTVRRDTSATPQDPFSVDNHKFNPG